MANSGDPGENVERAYSVNELADEAGVTRRTVHYYISQGLLPPSGSEGRGTRYGKGHLDRLLLIRELQGEHLPLAEIRQRLERLSDDQIADLLATGAVDVAPRTSAFDYVQSVLSGTHRRTLLAEPVRPMPPPAAAPLSSHDAQAGERSPSSPASAPRAPEPTARSAAAAWSGPAEISAAETPARSAPRLRGPAAAEAPASYSASPPEPAGLSRSQWERITLAPDIELHIRRPLGRLQNRAVDRLVALARQLLKEDPS